MKILHLVLYSKNTYYDVMKSITDNFYGIYKNVDTYYYYFDDSINNDYELTKNELKIKGIESYKPGILDKTIKAFKYFENKLNDYDYIVRSNISTIIDFDKIYKILYKKNYDYGFYLFNRSEYRFSSGTSILLSNKMVFFILENINKIDYDKIDDVAIGLLIFKSNDKIRFCDIKDKICFNYKNESIDKYVIYRNKTKTNRNIDIKVMQKIVDLIKKRKTLLNKNKIIIKKINIPIKSIKKISHKIHDNKISQKIPIQQIFHKTPIKNTSHKIPIQKIFYKTPIKKILHKIQIKKI